MQIYNTPIMYNYNVKNKDVNSQPNFKGVKSLSSVKDGHSIEYGMRILGNKFNDFFATKGQKQLTKNIANIKVEPTRLYMEQLSEIGRLYSTQKVIDVNIEDSILEKLAEKGESIIFVMNHSNQSEDPQMLAVLNTLLTDAYKKTGREDFPLPKIILNEDILTTMNPIKRKAFENFGAVGVDASIEGGDSSVNARALFPLVKDFVRNKCNIFIFPEGRLAVSKTLDLQGRFQPGVASLINKMLGIKKKVTVVPVGFAYGKGAEKTLTAMNIGTPLEIKRDGITTTITRGDVDKNKDSILYSFFDKHSGEQDVPITKNGEPVEPKEVTGFLKTIICDNLETNSNIAKKKLEVPLEEEGFSMY